MKPNTFARVALCAALLAYGAKSATAAPIVFSDVTAFRAAAGPTSVLTFNDLATGAVSACLPASPAIPDPCELDYGGATFVSTVGLVEFNQRPLLFAHASGLQPSNGLGATSIPIDADDFFFTFYGNAVGFWVWGGYSTPVAIDVEDSNGQTFNYAVIADAFVPPFFGVVSDVALNKVSLYSLPIPGPFGPGFANFTIDDVELQPVPDDDVELEPVPEPSTLALVLGGVVLLVRQRLGSRS